MLLHSNMYVHFLKTRPSTVVVSYYNSLKSGDKAQQGTFFPSHRIFSHPFRASQVCLSYSRGTLAQWHRLKEDECDAHSRNTQHLRALLAT